MLESTTGGSASASFVASTLPLLISSAAATPTIAKCETSTIAAVALCRAAPVMQMVEFLRLFLTGAYNRGSISKRERRASETAGHERASHDYAATGSKILELAKNAHGLFIRQDPSE